eukprot:TRINITY_DN12896_c0_g1_i1.p1 TRINITY_DN12896_c0_g1~~TRINITY_DN12896_c0_g1_i1.p1  ORF type:complete len:149 (+),score=28.12 TRINITY_DN12896_c0_g1_i1:34-480(+)
MDPASILYGLPSALKFVKDNLPTSENGPMFGYGNPEEECECKRISLFMSLRGTTTEERRRVLVSNVNVPLKETRALFGKPFTQISILDENGYRFNDPDLDKPLYFFSNKCRLNISFAHNSVLDHVPNLKPNSWWGSGSSGSPTPEAPK